MSGVTPRLTGGAEAAVLAPPTRGEILRTDSRPASLAATVLGVASLVIAIGGSLAYLAVHGLSSAQLVAHALKSPELQLICIVGIACGLAGMAVGGAFYRRMNTRTARSQSVNGILLGLQGAIAGGAIAAFVQGDMETFSRNFLNFPDVISWMPYFVAGFGNTLVLTGASTVLGLVLGLIVAMFLISERKVLRAPARIYVNVLRGTPMLVEISIVYFGLALGLRIDMTPGTAMIIALALNASAYMAEVFRAGLQSIGKGQLDAARGLGLTYGQSLWYAIIPQATRRVIPPLMNDFITITKETSLIAFLGVAMSGREMYTVALQGYSQFFNSTFFIAAGAGYLAITLPLIWLVNVVEKKIRSGLVGIGS